MRRLSYMKAEVCDKKFDKGENVLKHPDLMVPSYYASDHNILCRLTISQTLVTLT